MAGWLASIAASSVIVCRLAIMRPGPVLKPHQRGESGPGPERPPTAGAQRCGGRVVELGADERAMIVADVAIEHSSPRRALHHYAPFSRAKSRRPRCSARIIVADDV
jgi:hypothetical protein